jgi:hypothetical protein
MTADLFDVALINFAFSNVKLVNILKKRGDLIR